MTVIKNTVLSAWYSTKPINVCWWAKKSYSTYARSEERRAAGILPSVLDHVVPRGNDRDLVVGDFCLGGCWKCTERTWCIPSDSRSLSEWTFRRGGMVAAERVSGLELLESATSSSSSSNSLWTSCKYSLFFGGGGLNFFVSGWITHHHYHQDYPQNSYSYSEVTVDKLQILYTNTYMLQAYPLDIV